MEKSTSHNAKAEMVQWYRLSRWRREGEYVCPFDKQYIVETWEFYYIWMKYQRENELKKKSLGALAVYAKDPKSQERKPPV